MSEAASAPGASDAAVLAATGRDWSAWRAHLDAAGAAALPHGQIVSLLHDQPMSGWWRQMVTVGYERMIGRRVEGQTCAGSFTAGVTRTVAGDMTGLMERWCALAQDLPDPLGVPPAGEPRRSDRPKWRYWRLDLADGSKLVVSTNDKAGGKASLAINHEGLADSAAVERAKAFWKEQLARL